MNFFLSFLFTLIACGSLIRIAASSDKIQSVDHEFTNTIGGLLELQVRGRTIEADGVPLVIYFVD